MRHNDADPDMQYVSELLTVLQRMHRADKFEASMLVDVRRLAKQHSGRVRSENNSGRSTKFLFNLTNSERKLC